MNAENGFTSVSCTGGGTIASRRRCMFSLKVRVVSVFKHNRCVLGWGFGLCVLQDQEKGGWAGFARGGWADCHHDLANRRVELNRAKKEKRENEKKGSLKLKGGQG